MINAQKKLKKLSAALVQSKPFQTYESQLVSLRPIHVTEDSSGILEPITDHGNGCSCCVKTSVSVGKGGRM